MEATSPLKNENDIAFMLDKKRKLETGFKIPKKKRLDEPPAEPPQPPQASPRDDKKEDEKANKPKIKKPRTQVTDHEGAEANNNNSNNNNSNNNNNNTNNSSNNTNSSSNNTINNSSSNKPKSKPLLQTPRTLLLDTPDPLPASDDNLDSETPTENKNFTLDEPKPEISQEYVTLTDGSKHVVTREVWLLIFSYLQPGNLSQCMRVCKAWRDWILEPRFWRSINLSRFGPIFPDMLKSIVFRQPVELDLSYCTISRKQAEWLLPRLPGLRKIRLSGLSTNIIGSLYGNMIPNLYHIDVRWVDDLNDWTLRDLLCVSAQGKTDPKPRFADLQGLQLAGCPISEDAIKNIVQFCPNLMFLDMSYNPNINDRVIDNLANSPLIYSLKTVDFSGCPNVTDKSLLQLKKCFSLEWLDFRSCKDITRGACLRFTHSSTKNLTVTEDKLIHLQLVPVYA